MNDPEKSFTIEGDDILIVSAALCSALVALDPALSQSIINEAIVTGRTSYAHIITKALVELSRVDGRTGDPDVDLLNNRITRIQELAIESGLIVHPDLAATIRQDQD